MLEAIKLLKDQSSFSVKSYIAGQSETPKNQINKVVAYNKFSARNIFVNARLKIRVSKMLNALASRRFNNFTPYLFQKINDKAFYNAQTNKVQELNKIQVEDEYQSNLLHKQLLANRRNSKLSKEQNYCSFLIQHIKFILESIPIVNPNSLPKLLWDSLLSFVIVVMLTVVPVKLAVQDHFLSYYLGTELVLILIIVLTIIDILINLNTAFFNNGKIVVKRAQIVMNYLNQVGIYDFLIMQALVYELGQSCTNNTVSNLSLTLKQNWFYQAQQILLLLLFYVKSQKLNKFFYKVEEMLSFKRRTTNFLSLVKLLFFILKVGHIFACLWLFVGRQDKDNSWLKNLSDDWKEQYIKSFYFIAVTMTTIGYGDIVPTNLAETIISIFSMIIAAGVFGYTINSIGTIFLQLKKEDEQIQENLFTINRYMSEKNITRELQQSIREYLEYYWSQWKDDNSEEEQKIICQLSEEMKMSLLLQANKMVLNDCQFLHKNFTQEALQNCVNMIKEKKLTPNEFLINSMEDNSKNGILFFVERGEIDIYQEFSLSQIQTLNQNDQPFINPLQNISNYLSQSQYLQGQMQQQVKMQNEQSNLIIRETQYSESNQAKMHVCTIKKGQYFGENSFFTNFPHKFIAKSRGFSKVLYFERDQFVDFLKANHFNDDYEKFCHLRDSIIQNDLQSLYQKCSICKNLDHNPLQCSYVHYQPLKLLILKRYNCSKDIKIREKCKRRKVKQKNCLQILDDIYQQFEKFIQKNENYIEENIKLVDYTISDLSDDFNESDQSSSEQESQQTIQQEQNNESNQLSQFYQQQNENNKIEDDQNSLQDAEADDNTSLFRHAITLKKQKQQEIKFRCNQALPNKQKQTRRANFLRSKTDVRAQTMKVEENQSDSSLISEKESQKQVEQKSHQHIGSLKKIEVRTSSNCITKIANQNSGKNIIPSISSFKRIIHQEEQQTKSFLKQFSQRNIEKQTLQNANVQYQRQSINPFNRLKTIKAGLVQRNAQRQSNYLESLHFQNQIQHEISNEHKKSSHLLEKKYKEENNSSKKQKKVQIQVSQEQITFDYTNFHLFQSEFAFVSQFEKMKNYKFYYPKFNSDKIISKLRRKRIQGNNILKLTLQAKSKTNQGRRESIFQVFQSQLNVIKSQRLSDKFKAQESQLIQLNEKNNQQNEQKAQIQKIQEDHKDTFSSHLTDKKLIDKAEPNKLELKSNSSSKNFFKNIKLNLSKKPLSPQQTMLINVNSKKKRSISDENNFDLEDEDFNFHKILSGNAFNSLKLSRTPSNFTKYDFIKNDSQQIDDNQTDIYQSNF
ncbi:hypothetical protein ABPG72_011332 [Tetrahymena utriculariae]